MALHGERRGCERSEIVGELWGSLGFVLSLPLRNLGSSGALLEVGQSLPLSSVHRIRLTLGETRGEVEVRVCRVEPIPGPEGPERYLIGVEFVQLPPSLAEQIDRLVAGPCPGQVDTNSAPLTTPNGAGSTHAE
jgi:hypothetical protein